MSVSTLLQSSGDRISQAAERWLPGFVALVAVLLVAFLVAVLVRFALRKLLPRARVDERAAALGFVTDGPGGERRSPSALIASLAFWFVMVLGFVMGLHSFDARITETLASRLLDYLPHVAAAVVILVAGVAVGRFLERSVLIRAVNLQIRSARLLSLGAKWLLIVLATAMALHHLGIGGVIVTISFTILFGGIVLALALAVGLGSQDAVGRALERELDRERRPGDEQKIRHF